MSIGKKIRSRREELGMTQDELAERIGVTQAMVAMIEKERKLPGVTLFADIAHELDTTMDALADKSA